MNRTLLPFFASLVLVAASANAQIINEFLADPAATAPDGDANGDGIRDGSADEFIEIYNDTALPLDISGWTIEDAFTKTDPNSSRHTFPPNTIVAASCAIIVFGGGTPTGSFGQAMVQTSSNGFLGLNNGGDEIILTSDGTTVVTSHTYGAEGSNNQSLTRDPDFTGTFVLHSAATGSGGALFSPGIHIDAGLFAGCSTVAIEESSWGTVKELYRN